MNRGISVVDAFKVLNSGKKINQQQIEEAYVLGWCVEWVKTNKPTLPVPISHL
jgi:hypothetical protein